MRFRVPVFAACLVALLAGRAPADTILPPVTDANGWADGEARKFSLTWNGQASTFTVDKVGTSTYRTLDQCCSDMFSRVLEINPGASLLFTQLALNTMPINTTFVDGLNLDLLRSETANIASLTGLITLQLPPDARRGKAVFDFAPLSAPLAEDEDPMVVASVAPPEQVPEPATLMLMGMGLLGVARMARKRASRL